MATKAAQTANLNPATWARAELTALGDPLTESNIEFFERWEAAEGGNWENDARYNPLNTTQEEPGAGNTGSQGNIKVYTSWAQGIQATKATLTNGLYSPINAALKSGQGSKAFSALQASPWDAGHYAHGFPSVATGLAYASEHGASTLDSEGQKATKAGKAAADYLYAQGLRGHDLVIALGIIGSETKGSFRMSDVKVIAENYKQGGGAKSFTGSSGYQNGAYINYIGSALLNLKAAGHTTPFKFVNSDPGNNAAKGSIWDSTKEVVGGEAKDIGKAATSVPDFLNDLTQTGTWVRIAFIVAGVILIAIGLSKALGSGGSIIPSLGTGASPTPAPAPTAVAPQAKAKADPAVPVKQAAQANPATRAVKKTTQSKPHHPVRKTAETAAAA